MKTILIHTIIFSLVFSSPIYAQDLHGGFGHGFFGPVYNISPELQHELRSPYLLGGDLQLNTFGMGGGGGGYALLPQKLLVGGSGFGSSVSDATEAGQARLTQGGGMVNLGYLVLKKNHLLGFPYLGIGGSGILLTVYNNGGMVDSVYHYGVAVAPGEETMLHAGGMSFDLGFSLKVLAFTLDENNRGGGFIIGFEAGSCFFAAVEDWHYEDYDWIARSLSKPYAFTPYVRITIGGGGFGKKKTQKENEDSKPGSVN